MGRVVIYSAPLWAFGVIHYDIVKYLFKMGIEAELLPWDINYNVEEFAELDKVTDVYLSTTYGTKYLIDEYNVNPSKIVGVAHGIVDIEYLLENKGHQVFNELRDYGVVSDHLKQKSRELGIAREPTLLPLGINTSRFIVEPAKKLNTLGYAGDPDGFHKEIKRGDLVKKVAKETGLELKIANTYHNHFVTMPGFYNSVDCILIASSEEGAGLPAMEAGAAGRLVIGTPVGHWAERIGELGGHTVALNAKDFVNNSVQIIKKYQKNQQAFHKKCVSIQRHAASYDWGCVLEPWLKVLS